MQTKSQKDLLRKVNNMRSIRVPQDHEDTDIMMEVISGITGLNYTAVVLKAMRIFGHEFLYSAQNDEFCKKRLNEYCEQVQPSLDEELKTIDSDSDEGKRAVNERRAQQLKRKIAILNIIRKIINGDEIKEIELEEGFRISGLASGVLHLFSKESYEADIFELKSYREQGGDDK